MAVMQAAAYLTTIKQLTEKLQAGETNYIKLEQVFSSHQSCMHLCLHPLNLLNLPSACLCANHAASGYRGSCYDALQYRTSFWVSCLLCVGGCCFAAQVHGTQDVCRVSCNHPLADLYLHAGCRTGKSCRRTWRQHRGSSRRWSACRQN